MQTTTEKHQLQTNLLQSIQQHERVLEYMQDLEKEVGTASPAALIKFNETLLELQRNISKVEKSLFTQLSRYSEKTNAIQSLIDRREHLVKEILSLNQEITVKATRIKSFIAYEMGKLHNGLSAMNGYRQEQHNQGRIINSSL